ncbi:MAG: pseudouridine-5'-phosphate glycosidase [Anaerolineales bacterium]|nr:pseudouridine-5'-phosphate glycosidase [Anaerolineales bacterium]
MEPLAGGVSDAGGEPQHDGQVDRGEDLRSPARRERVDVREHGARDEDRGQTGDISADLPELARTPMIVVCAGAKAILDLPATLEVLETLAVPVIGYQTDEFPAFYSRHSGLPVSLRLDSPEEVVRFARTHWGLGFRSAVLVCQPLSPQEEIPAGEITTAIQQARRDAHDQGIRGQPLTPFLLSRLAKLTGGASLRANLALLLNNASLAARIACALHTAEHSQQI